MGRKVPVEEDRQFIFYWLQKTKAPDRMFSSLRRLADKASKNEEANDAR